MFAKVLIIGIFVAILATLASALRFVVKDRGTGSNRAAKALTLRVALSIALFALLFVLLAAGLIHPHALGR